MKQLVTHGKNMDVNRCSMKNFLLLIFIHSYCLQAFAQKPVDSSSIYCKYEVSYAKDTLDNSKRINDFAILLIGNNTSIFRSQTTFQRDSIKSKVQKEIFSSKPEMASMVLQQLNNSKTPNFKYEVYKKNEIVKIFAKVMSQFYSFNSEKKIKWEVSSETKIISTFSCKKAIGKYGDRKVFAWYTTDIPIPEGPYNFKGLPGLIIEAYDENKTFHFILKHLKEAKIPINPNDRAVSTTYDKFLQKREEFKLDPSGHLRNRLPSVLKDQMTKTKTEDYNKRMRGENNFLD